MRVAPALACLLFLIRPAAVSAQAASELYALRITNTLYGPVEISVDQGATWTLVGRVAKPAVDRAPGAGTNLPAVERASPSGLAFGVGKRKFVRLLPDSPVNRRDPCAVVVNVPFTAALFKDLLPGSGSPVREVLNRRPIPLPADYMPQDGDQLEITALQSSIPREKLAAIVKDAGERYQDAALARVRAAGRKPTSGLLTITCTPAPGEMPEAVTFLLDGAVMAILNRAPFSYRFDTRTWTSGEHLVEVRGLNANGASFTQKKALIVVQNTP